MAVVIEAGAVPPRARILVVEDDLVIRGTIARYLREYDIDVAEGVESAMQHIDKGRYDLLLLDRRLPDGTGDSMIPDVRKKRGSIPIIVMSGEIDLTRSHTGPIAFADDFIEKPFVREALLVKIERLLTAHMLRKQAERQRRELIELHQRHEREVEVARGIFDKIFARGEFIADKVRHLVLAADRLAGDVVFGARLGDDVYRWMIGDVTGHTLSSALVTLPLAGIFYRTARERAPMESVLAMMELELIEILPANMFCVGAMCDLDRRAGTLRVWNGGHPDVLIRHIGDVAGDVVTRVPSMGMPLGADRFSPPNHPIVAHRVAPGDRIYAFSDGLLELRDRTQKMIGFDCLLEITRSTAPAAIFGKLLDCIPDYTGARGYDDDVSLIEVIV